jgi:hypothetical protein
MLSSLSYTRCQEEAMQPEDAMTSVDPGERSAKTATSLDRSLADDYPSAGLTKVTANLVQRSVTALNAASSITGDNRTDVINRSLQIYSYLMKVLEEGKLVFVKDPATGEVERLVIL